MEKEQQLREAVETELTAAKAKTIEVPWLTIRIVSIVTCLSSSTSPRLSVYVRFNHIRHCSHVRFDYLVTAYRSLSQAQHEIAALQQQQGQRQELNDKLRKQLKDVKGLNLQMLSTVQELQVAVKEGEQKVGALP